MSAFCSELASADENAAPPSPPLQWPSELDIVHGNFLPLPFVAPKGLRFTIEHVVDLGLCAKLMEDAKIPVPPDLETCPPTIQAKIDNREGSISWADGARP